MNGAEKTIAAGLLGEQLGDEMGINVAVVARKAFNAFGHIHGSMGYKCGTCGFKARGPVWVMLPVMADHDALHIDGSRAGSGGVLDDPEIMSRPPHGFDGSDG